jgi:ABC-type antimicrobial peptide transport system permease subunit
METEQQNQPTPCQIHEEDIDSLLRSINIKLGFIVGISLLVGLLLVYGIVLAMGW